MADKTLVIDTAEHARLITRLNTWNYIEQQESFISSIETSTINDEGVDVGSIVSGIPTVFARVNLFRSAIAAEANPTRKSNSGNLATYYTQLAREWKGFIAAIACDYPNFNVRRVDMRYSDENPAERTKNIYEPKGAFGNMLMVGKVFWCNQIKGDPSSSIPFIDIIRYDGQVVGGTSPDTMVFTSIGYHISKSFAAGKPWIDPETGRFIDPLQCNIGQNHLRTLYAYVNYLLSRVPQISEYYRASQLTDGRTIDYSNLTQFLRDWRDEIRAYASHPSHNFDIEAKAIPTVNIFELKDGNNPILNRPYSDFFNYQNKLWGLDGNIYDSAVSGAIAFDPQELLLPEESEIARIILRPDTDETQLPMLLLKAHDLATGGKAFFALPISPKGLEVFGKNLGALVGAAIGGTSLKSELKATYDPNASEKQLRVTIRLVNSTNSNDQECERAYTIKPANRILQKDILIWPNFVSKQWDRYFLYSEMPHSVQDRNYPYRATPFVADVTREMRILAEEDGSPVMLAKDGKVYESKKIPLKVKLHVVADSRIADREYKYEIYESNYPFKGMALTSAAKAAGGFLIIRYDTSNNSNYPQDMTQSGSLSLKKVNLGIDFGSTNTSIAFYDPNGESLQAQGFTFENLRISLFGNNKPMDIATPNQLFFFPNASLRSNAIKSILTLHERARMVPQSQNETETDMYSREVKGGFPCFIRNLPIKNVERNSINIDIPGCGNVNLINDMKWTANPEDSAHKIAFLRTLMLQIYAQLFSGVNGTRMVPVDLKWSYPSSMPQSLCQQYQKIWRSLRGICPILNGDGNRYDLDIASFNVNLGDPIVDGGGKEKSSGENDGNWGDLGGSSDWVENTSKASSPIAQEPIGASFDAGNIKGGGWGETEDTDDVVQGARFQIEDPSAQVVYNPQPLIRNVLEALPEACAVANYLATNGNVNVSGNNSLTLCFDIGGSTTDITALCKLRGKKVSGVTMIKQNSIRFAAQNVARATRKSPNFRNILLEICNRYDLHIEGLSAGADSRYTPDTAPYYFEQIVDRLKPEQLKFFYELITMNCQELMCVNIYVTGLIMFYAGQLTAKIVHQLKHSTETMLAADELPMVSIAFAGKGARLFEWWSTTDYQAAMKYYLNQFIIGMGGVERAKRLMFGPPKISLSGAVNEDVKFEVSKGLASSNTSLFIPKNNKAVEIIGENGFARVNADFTRTILPADHVLTPEMMSELGQNFVVAPSQDGKPTCTQFMNFTHQFYQVASAIFNLKMTQQDFMNYFRNMNIDSYVTRLPEYINARKKYEISQDEPFSYLAPMIILEGAKFFNDNLA